MNLRSFSKQPSLATPWVMTADGASLLSDLPVASASTQLESARLIIPRQYLFYLYIDLTAVPNALRNNLIQQRLQQASPFSHPASWVVQEAGRAQIWFWDESAIRSRRERDPALPTSVLPETLLQAPFEQGFRIQTCLFGWELQYWDAGNLRHTRWLPQWPDARAQADFVRTCGYSLDRVEWAEADATLLARPWNEKPFWSKETLTSESVATKLIAGILLVWVTLELGMGAGTLVKESWLASSVAAQNEAMFDLVNQRDGALRQQEFNRAVTDLIAAPSPLFLSAQVHQCLADFDFVILDWQYQRGQLALVLQKEGLDTRALIEACTANTAFVDVRVEPGITPDQTRVLFNLPTAVSEGDSDV
ncbi:hypothetical protein [Cellvibrio sp. OA-2007]|uniref:hypothetical protein n=1 Tax=Cellvibrio sp. OA-2007 TaxID=529823 RepID=UPI00126A6DFD|nr:hypothetical protein [Cellvibrio sp. OA-2007]